MSAVGWTSLVRLFRHLRDRGGRLRGRAAKRQRTIPGLESLELISLLSSGGLRIGAVAAVRSPEARHHRREAPVTGAEGSQGAGMAVTPATVTLPPQTASLSPTLTNFVSLPLSPPLNLFNPALGTLTSVVVTQAGDIQGDVTATNRSTTSTTMITGFLTGNFEISGLNQSLVQPTKTVSTPPEFANFFGQPGDTVKLPTLHISLSSTQTFTDPASLAFFTASPGHTSATVTATMTANGTATAHAPNGNLATLTVTTRSGMVTVIYSYVPAPVTPPPCPTAGPVGRIGLHHQKTLLVVPFQGVVNPVLANMPSNYVVTHYGHKIRIISANYNPSTNTVILQPAHQLNVHHRFHLLVTLPCANGMTDMVVRLPFGRKYSLIGFHNHLGDFVPVHIHNGHIVRGDPPARHEHRPGHHR
jgi:hypothetical protein